MPGRDTSSLLEWMDNNHTWTNLTFVSYLEIGNCIMIGRCDAGMMPYKLQVQGLQVLYKQVLQVFYDALPAASAGVAGVLQCPTSCRCRCCRCSVMPYKLQVNVMQVFYDALQAVGFL